MSVEQLCSLCINQVCSGCGNMLFYSPRTLAESSGGRPFAEWILNPSMANQLHLDGTPICEGAHVDHHLRKLLCAGVESAQ